MVYNSLTGRVNRTHFENRLTHAISLAKRQGFNVGVFFMDIDDFKRINDEFGHIAGDLLICAVTTRLQHVFVKSIH